MGSIYKQKNKDGTLKSKYWWIKYYRHGKPIRESARSTDYDHARKLMKMREGRVAEGKPLGINMEKVTIDELAQDYLNDYQANERRSIKRAREIVKNLTKFFSGARVANITTDKIRAYQVRRKTQLKKNGQAVSNGTINRELGGLKHMLNLGAKNTPPKVAAIPYIPMLEEAPARSGFFERDEFLSIRGRLPDHAKIPVTIAFYTGMRSGEIFSLRWDQIKLNENEEAGKIMLESGQVKNKTQRTIFFNDDLYRVLARAKKIRDERYPRCPWVCHRKGERLKSIRRTWRTTTEAVGLEGMRMHDFRRTGIRDMVSAGVPEKVAMTISGHKTRSVFDRYNIVNETNLKTAAEMIRVYHQAQKIKNDPLMGIVSGIVDTHEQAADTEVLEKSNVPP